MTKQSVPQTVLFSGAKLLEMKERGDAPAEVLAYLRERAEALLSSAPMSVTQRQTPPPTNDPRDYASIGIYWWPNPDTENGLPYIRRDGERNPITREEVEIGKFASRVFSLALAAFYFDDARFANKAQELLSVWFLNEETRMNPHGEYAQSIPGVNSGRGIGLIEFIPFTEVMDAVAILESFGGLPPETARGIRSWFRTLTDWMLTSENGAEEARQHNNHGAWFDVQLLAMARFTSRPQLAKRIVFQSIDLRQNRHIAPDGSLPHELARTRAMHYSLYGLNALLLIARMATLAGDKRYTADEEDGAPRLRRAADFLLPYLSGETPFPYPELNPSTIGDAAAEMLYYMEGLFPHMGYAEAAAPYLKPHMLFRLTPYL